MNKDKIPVYNDIDLQPGEGLQGLRREYNAHQVNVAKSPEAHDIALSKAYESKCDIVLIQEPWTSIIDGQRRTKSHPSYDVFFPTEDWGDAHTHTNKRPRVATYTRRDAGLRPEPLAPLSTDHRDILWTYLAGPKTTICNLY